MNNSIFLNNREYPFFEIDFESLKLRYNQASYDLNGLAIVVSPHQDDESIGMGGTIAKLVKSGFKVYVIFTTIEKLNLQSNTNPLIRKYEAESAISELGVDVDAFFLDFTDGDSKLFTLDFAKSVSKLKNEIKRIELETNVIRIEENNKEILIDNKHTLILTTSRMDAHRDHEETFNMIKNGVRKKIILEFPVVNHMSSAFEPNCIIDISDFYDKKMKALSAHSGEEKKGRIMWEDIDDLTSDVGSIINVERAEACYISWYGYIHPSVS